MERHRTASRIVGLATIGALAVACSSAPGASPSSSAAGSDGPAETTTIRFSWDWKPDGDWSPILWAEEQGYFAEEGLKVEFVAGDGSSAVLPLLASGNFDLAQLSAPPVVLAAAEDYPITVVGVQMPDSPNVVIADGSITEPAQIKGKKVGLQVGEFEEALWEAWFKANGIERSEIDEVPIADIGADVLFIDHQVDVILDFYTSGVIPSLTDGREGEETLWPIRDSLDVIGHTLVANNTFLAENPDAVRAFQRAFARGMLYTIQHPDETVDLILDKYPENERTATEWSVERYIEAWQAEGAGKDGFLVFEPALWDVTKGVLVDGGLMDDVDISDLYSTDYFPEPAVTP
jgi:ABC-type nitrate/sulfonate/bicarbonate transport system substrate-binding protein